MTDTNAKHTPGPWAVTADRDDCDGLSVIQQQSGGLICLVESTLGQAVADEANARLIAAAPEMLAELAGLSAIWTNAEFGSEVMDYLETRIHAIRATITKATGKAALRQRAGFGLPHPTLKTKTIRINNHQRKDIL
jgi:hypothetical protein